MEVPEKLLNLVKKSASKIPKSSAIAFSGGVDSCAIAALVKQPKLYVVGTENASDIKASIKAANKFKLPLKIIKVQKEDIFKAIPIVETILNSIKHSAEAVKNKLPSIKPSPISIGFNLPLYFVCKYAPEKNIVCAQGPDPLLGGYSRHLKMSKEEAEKDMSADLTDVLMAGQKQYTAIGKYFGKIVLLPYLEKEIISFCQSIDFEWKIKNNLRKRALVEAAKLIMPAEIAEREKKAAQYGSGVMKYVKQFYLQT